MRPHSRTTGQPFPDVGFTQRGRLGGAQKPCHLLRTENANAFAYIVQ